MKIIYTAIFGNYDTLAPIKVPEGWRALCFTDSGIVAKGWEIIHRKPEPKLFRKIKICPHLFLPEHEISMWIDGNLSPQMPLNHLVNNKTGYWAMAHPQRHCVYAEAKRCIELGKDTLETLNAQMERYRRAGLPRNAGMVATGVLIRTPGFEKFAQGWWAQVEKGSHRDQCSFNYVAWKHKLEYHTFPFLQNFSKVIHSGK